MTSNILSRLENKRKIHAGGEGRIIAGELDGEEVIVKLYHDGNMDYWDDFEKAEEGAAKEIAFLRKANQDEVEGVPYLIESGVRGEFNEPYSVMKRVKGETLEERLSFSGFNPTVDEARDILKRIAVPLHYAHYEAGAQPFTHRDLKPANLMLDEENNVTVLDWSTGKIGSGETLINTMINSLWYTAPEVALGKSVTPSADVYSLGKILQHYFLGSKFVKQSGEVNPDDWKRTNVPSHIIEALEKATSLDSEKRYQTVDELVKGMESTALVVSGINSLERKGTSRNFRGLDGLDFFYAPSGLVSGVFIGYLLEGPFVAFLLGIFGVYSASLLRDRIEEGKTSRFSGNVGNSLRHPIESIRLRGESKEYFDLVQQWKKLTPREVIEEAATHLFERRKSGQYVVDRIGAKQPLSDDLSPCTLEDISGLFEFYKQLYGKSVEGATCHVMDEHRGRGTRVQQFSFKGRTLLDFEYDYVIERECFPRGAGEFHHREERIVTVNGKEIYISHGPVDDQYYLDRYGDDIQLIESAVRTQYETLWHLAQLIPHPRRSFLTAEKVRKDYEANMYAKEQTLTGRMLRGEKKK